jgi:hypothetical protein
VPDLARSLVVSPRSVVTVVVVVIVGGSGAADLSAEILLVGQIICGVWLGIGVGDRSYLDLDCVCLRHRAT